MALSKVAIDKPARHAFLPHVQGLRAIAVLTVILHHIEVSYLPGGFIGVDIFFVISGFLITGHILKQRSENAFSLFGFYFRRIRRIIPNQLLVIFVVLAAAYVVLDRASFELTAASAAYSSVLLANVFFLQNSGYFAPAAETMPLLHMWSLAVEEQFYLIWPATIAIFAWLNPKLRWFLIVATIISLFAATQWAVEFYPDAAFYLTPFRILEFMCGAALAIKQPELKRLNNLFTVTALAIILACLLSFSPETPFPGVMALIPCFATAAIIAFGHDGWATRILGSLPARAIGDRSYALYLVHWPVIIFLDVSLPLLDPGLRVLVVLFATIILTEMMYQFWEKPLRYWSLPKFRHQLGYAVGVFSVALCIAAIGGSIGKEFLRGGSTEKPEPKLEGCSNNDASNISECVADVLVIGDSHSDRIFKVAKASSGKNIARSSFLGCPPVFGTFKQYNSRSDRWKTPVCRALVSEWEKEIPNSKAHTIVIAARWAWLTQPGEYAGQVIREESL